MRRSRLASALLLAAFLAGCASVPVERPEGPVPVKPGDRVRVTLSNRFAPAPLIGTLETVSADALTVRREEGGVRQLSRAQVAEVAVSIARTEDPARAAGEAVLAGAPWLIPLTVVIVLYGSQVEGELLSPILAIVAVPVALLALTGAIIGGGPQDVWVPAAWPPDPDAPAPSDSVDPAPEGR